MQLPSRGNRCMTAKAGRRSVGIALRGSRVRTGDALLPVRTNLRVKLHTEGKDNNKEKRRRREEIHECHKDEAAHRAD